MLGVPAAENVVRVGHDIAGGEDGVIAGLEARIDHDHAVLDLQPCLCCKLDSRLDSQPEDRRVHFQAVAIVEFERDLAVGLAPAADLAAIQ